MNSSGITDEFSVVEFHSPKIEYTRSQLMDLQSMSSGQTFKMNENVSKSVEANLKRKSSANVGAPIGKNKTEQSTAFTDGIKGSEFESYYATAVAKLQMEASVNRKVDHWLNSGQNPREYAQATDDIEYAVGPAKTFDLKTNTAKADETSSTVSNQSAIRAKLLDKTAKVKQNLQKLTKNNLE